MTPGETLVIGILIGWAIALIVWAMLARASCGYQPREPHPMQEGRDELRPPAPDE